MLSSNPWMNGTVTIDSTVGKDTFCLVTWDKQPPGISLWDPVFSHNFNNDTIFGSQLNYFYDIKQIFFQILKKF